ncbi:MAG: hypothetical protein WCK35_16100 [Chloroflexota bacterium]
MNKAQSRHQFQEITSSQVCGRCTVVASSAPVTDADRAALADLFKQIAEFGRRIREHHTVQSLE